MFIPKWLLENILRQLEDNEIRIKRLELIQLQQAQNRIENAQKEIADLRAAAGKCGPDGERMKFAD